MFLVTHSPLFFNMYIGISTAIGCMASKCNVRVPEEFILRLLTKPIIRDKYQQFAFLDYVKSHPELRFCPGPNCQVICARFDSFRKCVSELF